MAKSPDAFRTISEVADWLGVQAHVLRFWESKFTQVKPIKRAGGRRYYRPNDMLLIGGIKQLLHEDGLTIKGVQKILREEGMGHVASLSQSLDELTLSEIDNSENEATALPPSEPEEEKGVVLNFEPAAEPEEAKKATEAPDSKEETTESPPQIARSEDEDEPPSADASKPTADDAPLTAEQSPTPSDTETAPTDTDTSPQDEAASRSEPKSPVAPLETSVSATSDTADGSAVAASAEPDPGTPEPPAKVDDAPASADSGKIAQDEAADLPAFLRRPLGDEDSTPAVSDNPPPNAPDSAAEPEAEPEAPPTPKPRILDLPAFTLEAEFPAKPAALSAVYKTRSLGASQARKIAPLLNELTRLRSQMSAQRRSPANPSAKN